ncbi:(+)-piperitol/(+)-sesamin synthase CYP81Q2-like [Rutidosis leptorrhynchoides]|uniref:(+)-piperitol/(+)-sesamin synthase CYP81Q2-like n=1 Tax=Rutidosis leptorrhynchoides TaxID=125765 RepID=UPI003A99632C
MPSLSSYLAFINAWTFHRDQKLWDDLRSLKSERFENEDNGQHKYLPFGLGRRAVPGANMAQRVIIIALGSLEWKRISEELVDMIEGEGINMPKVVPLEAMCKPRKIMARIAEH